MKPLFSVIIPTLNRASIIDRTLDSVLSQTFNDWECLIVDDFSTDNTKEVVKNYCEKDSRFIYLTNEIKKGAQGARNTGILHARGKYISFLDSDDTWLPNMLEKQNNKYLSDKNIDCVYTKLQTICPDGNTIPWDIFIGLEGHIYKEVLKQGYMSATITLSVKKECFDEISAFDLDFPASQDDDMCFRLAKKYKIGFIPEILANVNASHDERISNNASKVAMGWWMLWNKYESDVLEYCGTDIMAKHYRECLHHFIQAQNANMSRRAYHKFIYFGGRLSKRKKIWLCAFILTGGKNKYITHKLQKKI